MNRDLFSQYISEIFYIKFVRIENGKIIYHFFPNAKSIEYSIGIDKLDNIIDEYLKLENVHDTVISSNNFQEILVSVESSRSIAHVLLFGMKTDRHIFEDKVNQIKYEIGKPSDLFLIHMLGILKKNEFTKLFPRPKVFSKMLSESDDETIDLFEFLKRIIPRFYSLKVSSIYPKKESEFQDLCNACLFDLGYHLNIPIVQVKSFQGFYSPDRILSERRSRIEDVDAPKRIYQSELISHYHLAISTDIASVQYLSFYHILEYFYILVFNEDLINTIEMELEKPDFSYSKTKLGKSFNEKDALKLTFKKFIPTFEKIRGKLNLYNPTLLDFYKKNKVSFTEGNKVNLDSNNLDEIYINLAQRIYSTRNSIVHSKDENKEKFIPFDHENDLWKEIPLIRFIAEEIILASSKIISST